ncbi:MAG: exodeoxyribonuclease VII small subunit [Gemmatimonadetes bacterium]|nr:exodeoxyribonuclease VII small subunit [Gemmatimonadota bacterium]
MTKRTTPGPAPAPAAEAAPSLAEELRRLEEIVRQLEREDGDLDKALALFEEGVTRLRTARERLAQAEAKVQKVLAEADGTLRLEPLDGGDGHAG